MSSNGMGGDYNKLMQHFETKFHSIASSIKRIGMRWEEVTCESTRTCSNILRRCGHVQMLNKTGR